MKFILRLFIMFFGFAIGDSLSYLHDAFYGCAEDNLKTILIDKYTSPGIVAIRIFLAFLYAIALHFWYKANFTYKTQKIIGVSLGVLFSILILITVLCLIGLFVFVDPCK